MMDAVNIVVLLGILFLALAITIIKLELVFKSVLHAYKYKEKKYEEKYKEEKRILKFQQREEESQHVELDLPFH